MSISRTSTGRSKSADGLADLLHEPAREHGSERLAALRAFAQRTAARRGRHVATVAVARKLAVLAWHLLTRGEDYAYQQPARVARKLRRLELAAGASRRKPGPKPNPVRASDAQLFAQRRVAEQAEADYRRLVADWQACGPKVGTGATPERASSKALEGHCRAAG